ncbi:MAG: family 65 glycosyl hydrolase [Treponema sp.]|jgi:alpha,alpha-trehalose phosphorylase|nr:family 65 glycosyl hydrolase [Treponema sp.]
MNLIYELDNIKTDEQSLLINETLFHNANGYIGVRSNFEEGYPDGIDTIRGAYINAFYDFREIKQAEAFYGFAVEKQTMPNVHDVQGITLYLGDEPFSMFTGIVVAAKRTLNMGAGYTERYIHWLSPRGKEAEIRIRRLTSFVRPHLFLIDYSVTALNFEGPVTFVSTHRGDVENYFNPADPRLSQEHFRSLLPLEVVIEGTASFVSSATSKSRLTIRTAVDHILTDGDDGIGVITTVQEGHGAASHIEGRVKKKGILTLYKYCIFTDSLRPIPGAAAAELRRVMEEKPCALYSAQEEYLSKFWEGACIEIEGDKQLEKAVAYNLFELIQSVGKDPYSNIAAKGLSGEGYEGHYFWDTEIYMEPFFTLTNPAFAKNLISYRYGILDEARKNARLLGHHRGALFPWRTIMGRECSGYFPAGTAQYHINGDIAWSVVSYYLATGDLSFIAEKGAEIVFECARLWLDVGNYYRGKFRINEVTGPDEYTCLVNNNYYTNASAQYNLRWAVRFWEILNDADILEGVRKRIDLSPGEIDAFSQAAEAMYLPYDEELKINPQDDSFLTKKKWDMFHTPKEEFPLLLHHHPLYLNRYQVCKQADTVLAHFIFEDAQSLETMRNSFLYYEEITTHDSSLSTCIYSIVASKLGFREKASRYFGDSAKLDILNLHGNTKDGIHTANMGGTWMAIVYGFAGLRIKESGIYFAPALPESWKTCRFKIRYQDSQILAELTGRRTVFTLLSGTPKIINVYGKGYELSGSVTVQSPNPSRA